LVECLQINIIFTIFAAVRREPPLSEEAYVAKERIKKKE
jgi:hypothetical protein